MFSGGDYEEVGRWLRNFVLAHAKRENLRVEAVVESEGPREGQSYGVRLRLGEGRIYADQLAIRAGVEERHNVFEEHRNGQLAGGLDAGDGSSILRMGRKRRRKRKHYNEAELHQR